MELEESLYMLQTSLLCSAYSKANPPSPQLQFMFRSPVGYKTIFSTYVALYLCTKEWATILTFIWFTSLAGWESVRGHKDALCNGKKQSMRSTRKRGS